MTIDKKNIRLWVMYLYMILIVAIGFALFAKS